MLTVTSGRPPSRVLAAPAGSLTAFASPLRSYSYPESTTIVSCPPLSCYDGLVSQPTKATYVPATMELPGTPATPITTKAPGSTIYNQTTVSYTTTNMIRNGTNIISDGTSTNYGPTAPALSSPVTGAASKKNANYIFGAALGVLLL